MSAPLVGRDPNWGNLLIVLMSSIVRFSGKNGLARVDSNEKVDFIIIDLFFTI